ncbi:Bug family tripartite tricarboxylate transporter substrate binding protein [Consotaella aegiceratis]|uniref:Bug family tripartite tricarboxylate transporter substrate binding protein n=1 Tax=Consotaella aegiceratis TaxID=3097961 RepID=UPI002F41CF1C
MQFVLKSAVLAAVCLAFAGTAHAEFPERNIEDVYPWAPGATMAVSQIIADAMGQELGVNISVVSTPGAFGTKAFLTAMDKPADGYAIIDGYVAPLVQQPMQGAVDYTYKDFIPLWSATSNSFAIGIRSDETRFTDFPSLIAYIKAHPGELRYTAGVAETLPHMVAANVLQAEDAVAQVVPYPEIDVGAKDLEGGILDFMVLNPGVYKTHKDSIKPVAVLSELERASETYGGAPRVQDFDIEIGMTGLAPMGWNWWVVKKGTPDDVVAKLRDAMGKALQREEVQQKITDMGFVPLGYGPDQYDEVVGPVADGLKSGLAAIAWEKEQLGKLQ